MLVAVMLFAVLAPVSSAVSDYKKVDVPWLEIYGDGEPIYNKDGEKIFYFSEMLNMGSNIEKATSMNPLSMLFSRF